MSHQQFNLASTLYLVFLAHTDSVISFLIAMFYIKITQGEVDHRELPVKYTIERKWSGFDPPTHCHLLEAVLWIFLRFANTFHIYWKPETISEEALFFCTESIIGLCSPPSSPEAGLHQRWILWGTHYSATACTILLWRSFHNLERLCIRIIQLQILTLSICLPWKSIHSLHSDPVHADNS